MFNGRNRDSATWTPSLATSVKPQKESAPRRTEHLVRCSALAAGPEVRPVQSSVGVRRAASRAAAGSIAMATSAPSEGVLQLLEDQLVAAHRHQARMRLISEPACWPGSGLADDDVLAGPSSVSTIDRRLGRDAGDLEQHREMNRRVCRLALVIPSRIRIGDRLGAPYLRRSPSR